MEVVWSEEESSALRKWLTTNQVHDDQLNVRMWLKYVGYTGFNKVMLNPQCLLV